MNSGDAFFLQGIFHTVMWSQRLQSEEERIARVVLDYVQSVGSTLVVLYWVPKLRVIKKRKNDLVDGNVQSAKVILLPFQIFVDQIYFKNSGADNCQ